jgi:hypothetical protein
MKAPLVDRIPFAKVAVVMAAVMIVGLGLCGVGMVVSNGGNKGGPLGSIFVALLVAGGACFWLSTLGLILLVPLWAILAIVKAVNRDQ